jgi:hypothetical protein
MCLGLYFPNMKKIYNRSKSQRAANKIKPNNYSYYLSQLPNNTLVLEDETQIY